MCLLAEAAYRAAATRFLLLRQKKPGKEKTTLAACWSGGTHCAPASLRSNSRRKYEGHHPSGARRLRARGLWQVELRSLRGCFRPKAVFDISSKRLPKTTLCDGTKNARIAPLAPTSAPKTHNSAEVFAHLIHRAGRKAIAFDAARNLEE